MESSAPEPRPPERMRIISLRMSEQVWQEIQDEATRSGVSASEFVREAVMFRLGVRWARTMSDGEIAERLRRLGMLRDGF